MPWVHCWLANYLSWGRTPLVMLTSRSHPQVEGLPAVCLVSDQSLRAQNLGGVAWGANVTPGMGNENELQKPIPYWEQSPESLESLESILCMGMGC
jgi:hypothetical protein